MTAYISLYKKAKKILDEQQVEITNYKDNKFFFTVKEYEVTLKLSKMESLWHREWTCSCTGYALKQDKLRCAHVIAAETFLVIANGKKENRRNTESD